MTSPRSGSVTKRCSPRCWRYTTGVPHMRSTSTGCGLPEGGASYVQLYVYVHLFASCARGGGHENGCHARHENRFCDWHETCLGTQPALGAKPVRGCVKVAPGT